MTKKIQHSYGINEELLDGIFKDWTKILGKEGVDMVTSIRKSRENQIKYDFVEESNRIEGIHRDPTEEELQEFDRFLELKEMKVADLQKFVSVYQPNARLRLNSSDNVYVGNHTPPKGGQEILYELDSIVNSINANKKSPYHNHIDYETLHPFTDGNGRSGRMLWAWQMLKHNCSISLGFLHTFYYQTLENTNRHHD